MKKYKVGMIQVNNSFSGQNYLPLSLGFLVSYAEFHCKNFDDFEFIGESRGIVLMGALEMVQDKKNKLPFDGSISIGERVANKCIENGLICRPLGPSIVLCPPFITSEEEMGIIFDTLEKTLKEVFSEVKSLGQ